MTPSPLMSEPVTTRARAARKRRLRDEETNDDAPSESTTSSFNSCNVDSDGNFNELSITQDDPEQLSDSEERAQKRKKPRQDEALWKYHKDPPSGKPLRGNSGQELFYCCKCGKQISSVTTARQHLNKRHGISIPSQKSAIEERARESIKSIFAKQLDRQAGLNPVQEKHLKSAIDEGAFYEALCRLVVVRNLPHSCIEWPEFRALLHTVNYTVDGLLIKSRRSIPILIGKTFVLHKKSLKWKLQNSMSKIHFTTDAWTAPIHTAFQAICAHFVDNNGELAKALLALREHKGSHGGEFQGMELVNVVKEYGLEDKIGYLVGDNHGSNDVISRLIAQNFHSYRALHHHRIRCLGHILNLACQAFLFGKDKDAVEIATEEARRLVEQETQQHSEHEYDQTEETQREWRKMGPLGKIHNLAVWLRRSTERYNSFKQMAGRSLPRDNDTRWNSWYMMLDVAIKLRNPIMVFIDENFDSLEDDHLDRNEWQLLLEMRDILKPFYDATKATEGDKTTFNSVLKVMDFLVIHLRQKRNEHIRNPRLSSSILKAWFALDKYYKLTDKTPVYAAALLLDPTARKAYLDDKWGYLEEEHPGTIDQAVAASRRLWEKNYKNKAPATQEASDVDLDQIENSFLRWEEEERRKRAATEDEFTKFIEVTKHSDSTCK